MLLIEPLATFLYKEKKQAVGSLIKHLKLLSDVLNPLSHHSASKEKSEVNIGLHIFEVMQASKELVVEMPWHFYPVQRHGYNPCVVTGNAWSHSHTYERLLRVILWTGESITGKMLIWNPSQINPIISDAKILERPKKT